MEQNFINQKLREYKIKEYLGKRLGKISLGQIKVKKIPLGEKIIIETNRPGMVVGSRGANIKDLTNELKREFKLENPQIEINEIRNEYLDPNVVAEKITSSLERFGTNRFKGIGHKVMEEVIRNGGRGVEVFISGKIPGARAKSWRFYAGYLKKCGTPALEGVKTAYRSAALKTGTVGVKVSIMPPDVELPDKISPVEEKIEEKTSEVKEETKTEEKKEKKPRKKAEKKEGGEKKKAPKKKTTEVKIENNEAEVKETPAETKAEEVKNEE